MASSSTQHYWSDEDSVSDYGENDYDDDELDIVSGLKEIQFVEKENKTVQTKSLKASMTDIREQVKELLRTVIQSLSSSSEEAFFETHLCETNATIGWALNCYSPFLSIQVILDKIKKTGNSLDSAVLQQLMEDLKTLDNHDNRVKAVRDKVEDIVQVMKDILYNVGIPLTDKSADADLIQAKSKFIHGLINSKKYLSSKIFLSTRKVKEFDKDAKKSLQIILLNNKFGDQDEDQSRRKTVVSKASSVQHFKGKIEKDLFQENGKESDLFGDFDTISNTSEDYDISYEDYLYTEDDYKQSDSQQRTKRFQGNIYTHSDDVESGIRGEVLLKDKSTTVVGENESTVKADHLKAHINEPEKRIHKENEKETLENENEGVTKEEEVLDKDTEEENRTTKAEDMLDASTNQEMVRINSTQTQIKYIRDNYLFPENISEGQKANVIMDYIRLALRHIRCYMMNLIQAEIALKGTLKLSFDEVQLSRRQIFGKEETLGWALKCLAPLASVEDVMEDLFVFDMTRNWQKMKEFGRKMQRLSDSLTNVRTSDKVNSITTAFMKIMGYHSDINFGELNYRVLKSDSAFIRCLQKVQVQIDNKLTSYKSGENRFVVRINFDVNDVDLPDNMYLSTTEESDVDLVNIFSQQLDHLSFAGIPYLYDDNVGERGDSGVDREKNMLRKVETKDIGRENDIRGDEMNDFTTKEEGFIDLDTKEEELGGLTTHHHDDGESKTYSAERSSRNNYASPHMR